MCLCIGVSKTRVAIFRICAFGKQFLLLEIKSDKVFYLFRIFLIKQLVGLYCIRIVKLDIGHRNVQCLLNTFFKLNIFGT